MKYPYAVERILDHFPKLKPSNIAGRLKVCTFVSLDKRYLYFQVPKAACTQIKHILRTIEGAPPIQFFAGRVWVTHREMFIHARPNMPLPSLIDLDDRTQREVLESQDFFRMTIVRNPYKRLISAWRNRVLFCEPIGREVYIKLRGSLPGVRNKSVVSFEEFVDYLENRCNLSTCDDHWRRQVDHIFFPALNFSCIGRVEQLGDALEKFEQHLGLSEPLVADGRNVSFPIGAASYTQELADKVYSLYQRDFEILGYDRNGWSASSNGKPARKTGVPEKAIYDEIIERNLVILGLYEERKRLRAQLHRVSRLHLLTVVNCLAECRSAIRTLNQEFMRRVHRIFQPAGRGKQTRVTSA